ncbi:hypothetical protein EYB26_005187 [Talaromyces marneffei]|uniref:Cell death-inducing p53-target protein 1 n=1 Tax=Talaromyces marneffei PM1 TaxID=1077442 RepID=A0A093V888_TALMA|nr:uncharacterized protein EYB26_005187 [Talaromyces marneffei]QGA17516.1 hypothetical protein EYB26_005187 [Talaromyces marneffei]
MEQSKDVPSTALETVREVVANTSHPQPIHEQSDNTNPISMPENHTTGMDVPTNSYVPAPPPYTEDKQAAPAPTTTTTTTNNPYPGYDPSQIRITVTPLQQLGDVPAQIDCPFCHTISLTNVTKTDSSQTTIAAVLCCLCCGIITVCLPSLLGWYQNVEHRCGNCKRKVAYKPNDGPIQIETDAVSGTQM